MKYFHDIDLQSTAKILNVPTASASGDLMTKGQTETLVNQLLAGFDYQKDVDGIQEDATLIPVTTAGKRYVITNAAALDVGFGTITGLEDGDIVEYVGSEFVVVYDVSVKGDGAITYNLDDKKYYQYANNVWEIMVYVGTLLQKKPFNVGDGAALEYTVNHAINSLDVIVQIYDNTSPNANVECDIERVDANNVKVKFNVAPTTDKYRVVVIG